MNFKHDFVINVNEQVIYHFSKVGIDLTKNFVDGGGLVDDYSTFSIKESHKRWDEISRLAKAYGAWDNVTTIFTAKELKSADCLEMFSKWRHGYPEPSDDFYYVKEVFDDSDYCSSCGVGLVTQPAPFKIKGEPKWGKKGIVQLHWADGVFFVKPEVWEQVFKPFGIDCMEVLHVKKKTKLETVVQLIVPELDVSLKVDGLRSETCSECHTVKYLGNAKGYSPPLKSPCSAPIFKTREYFGSGASAFKTVIVSQALYQAIQAYKLKGAGFTPLEPSTN